MSQFEQCSECGESIMVGVGHIAEEPASKSTRERRKNSDDESVEDFDPFFATRFVAACDCETVSVYVNTNRAGAFLKSGSLPDKWKPELEEV